MTVLTVNGEKREIDVDPATPLLWVIREQLALLAFKPYRRHRCSQWWWRWSPAKLVVLCKWHSPRRQLQTQTACFVIMQCFEMTQKIAPV